jgi:hypothetical protein
MAKSASKSNAPMLPKGFKPIEHLGSFWSGQKPGDTIQGKYLGHKVKHFPKGKYPARDANIHTLDVKGKKIEITQSGGLGALEEVKKGQTVWIAYMGQKKLPGKKSMREYTVAVK